MGLAVAHLHRVFGHEFVRHRNDRGAQRALSVDQSLLCDEFEGVALHQYRGCENVYISRDRAREMSRHRAPRGEREGPLHPGLVRREVDLEAADLEGVAWLVAEGGELGQQRSVGPTRWGAKRRE